MAIPNRATLNELYIKKKMSLPKIGKKFHVHYITMITIEKQKKRNSSHPKIAITTTDKNLSN